jgi:Ser/Thr protein kinase RdoA (MazF antagonist)
MFDNSQDERYSMSNFFYDLTPDIILQAVTESGFDPTGHCMTLNSYENRVYDLKLSDDSHIIVKFYRPGRWSETQIKEEHDFLLEIQAEEIPVCAPLGFPDQQTIHQIEGIYFAVWPRTGGRACDELSDMDLQILARLLARIHNIGAAKKAEYRIELTGKTYGLEPLQFLEEHGFLPAQYKTRFRNAVEEIAAMYDHLSKDVPFHRIHGDCHLGNLLHGREGWFFLDFDDFLRGPAVQDVWMLVPARDREGLRQREVFLEAYQQFRDFDSSWLRLIEPLRGLRYIRYAAWIAQRWDDPAFPAAFPHFGTDDYWQKETSDLEEVISYFHKTAPGIPSVLQREQHPEEQELTNKDFFWDLDE